MNNEEICSEFLQEMYDRYYDDKPNEYLSTEEIIQNVELSDEDRNTVNAPIDYLKIIGHSSRFWDFLYNYDKKYKNKVKWLEQNNELIFNRRE